MQYIETMYNAETLQTLYSPGEPGRQCQYAQQPPIHVEQTLPLVPRRYLPPVLVYNIWAITESKQSHVPKLIIPWARREYRVV